VLCLAATLPVAACTSHHRDGRTVALTVRAFAIGPDLRFTRPAPMSTLYAVATAADGTKTRRHIGTNGLARMSLAPGRYTIRVDPGCLPKSLTLRLGDPVKVNMGCAIG
jgi:hypothetical protein